VSTYDWRDDPTFEGIEDPEPTRTARTAASGRFEPSEADRAWAAEASERGAFLPTIKAPGRPSRRRGRGKWGDAK
jgi:hypothetical protein